MKILKPGKVEQRKFVCPSCGCIFVADCADTNLQGRVSCPHERCTACVLWDLGEPYEEPTTTRTDKDRLAQLLRETRTIHIQSEVADYLIAHGVTFREGWV